MKKSLAIAHPALGWLELVLVFGDWADFRHI